MRSPLLIIGVLLVIALFTALIGPYFVDWSQYRADIEKYGREITGRDVSVDGVIDISLLPLPNISLGNVSVANAQGAHADKFLTAHAHYQFRKFLATQIPEVWLMGIKENLFVNYLATPTSKNYFELGYSIDNIFRFFRLEAAFSFQDGRYQDFGVLIGVASNLEDLFN